ncbi:uncharacterized protein G2W53_022013 [Senna tora]|uniref:Uncharacterized protein n=1 Tax=Senna tora TaxID=362788 RepID=A0A834TMA0_9FABA|nr:uncharacterized protein G2W53_022013 [Senna tora]
MNSSSSEPKDLSQRRSLVKPLNLSPKDSVVPLLQLYIIVPEEKTQHFKVSMSFCSLLSVS